MNKATLPEFTVIGIAVRTTNENGQATKDIPALWNRFMSEGLIEKIPGRVNNSIYCIYTDYEKDHTKPYTTLLGCCVKTGTAAPEGMTSKTFKEAAYSKRTVKGNVTGDLVFNEWLKIWAEETDRTFVADFEIYDEKYQDPTDASVDIFVGVQ